MASNLRATSQKAGGGEEDHIAFWMQKGLSYLELRVGAQNIGNIKLGVQVVVGLVVVWMALSLWRVIRHDPLKGRDKKQPPKKKPEQKKQSKNTAGDTEDGRDEHKDQTEHQEGEESDTDISAQVPHRSRRLNEQNCTSVIKGFARCQMGHSPCGRYVVYGCQKTEKLHVHPMKYLRPRLGKELSTKGFLDLDSNLEASMASGKGGAPSKVSIGAIGFSEDGSYCVLGECNTDTFHVFAMGDSIKTMTKAWSYKLPRGRMVSNCFDSVAVDVDGMNVYGFHNKNCEVEVIHRNLGHLGKEKFKLGDATSWCHGGGDMIIASGSYMHDIRAGKLHRSKLDSSGLHLDRCHVLQPKTRIAAMSMTTRGVLAGTASSTAGGNAGLVSTKSYLVTMDEKGQCNVFDFTEARVAETRGAAGNEPRLVCSFVDPDYDASITPASKCQGISWTMTGEPHHERLHIAFWNSMDCAIYRQKAGGPGSKSMEFDFLQDIHSVHDGENIRALCFVNGGYGIMSVSSGHSKGARMWDLVDAGSTH